MAGRLVATAISPPDAPISPKIIDFQFAFVVALLIRPADGFGKAHLGTCQPFEIAGLADNLAPVVALPHRQSRSESSHDLPVFGNQDGPAEHFFESRHNPPVQGGPPQEHDPLADEALLHDPVEVVMNDGVAEPGDQILPPGALLSVAHQVGFHENGTAFRQVNGRSGG